MKDISDEQYNIYQKGVQEGMKHTQASPETRGRLSELDKKIEKLGHEMSNHFIEENTLKVEILNKLVQLEETLKNTNNRVDPLFTAWQTMVYGRKGLIFIASVIASVGVIYGALTHFKK